MRTPRIGPPSESSDFHDSSLVGITVEPDFRVIRLVVSTPDERGVERLWMIVCEGVLRFEMEHAGPGSEVTQNEAPIEVYTVYNDLDSCERQRWIRRLIGLGVSDEQARAIWHLVLASSFMRGWGDNEDLEGMSIVCRSVAVRPAPAEYAGREFSRPRIDGR